MANSPQWELTPGETIRGRFEVAREIGRGPHGVAFLARDTALRRDVVLKAVYPDLLAGDWRDTNLFRLNRARAHVHAHLVPVLELLDHRDTSLVVTPYVPAPNLHEWLAQHAGEHGGVDPGGAAEVLRQLCTAVERAHLIAPHGNLRPSNVFVDSDGLLLADGYQLLGRGEVAPEAADELPRDHYLAPEQREDPLDEGRAADVYAMGLLLGELLAGAPVQPGQPLGEQGTVSSEGLDEAFLRATAAAPEERFATVSEWRDAALAALAALPAVELTEEVADSDGSAEVAEEEASEELGSTQEEAPEVFGSTQKAAPEEIAASIEAVDAEATLKREPTVDAELDDHELELHTADDGPAGPPPLPPGAVRIPTTQQPPPFLPADEGAASERPSPLLEVGSVAPEPTATAPLLELAGAPVEPPLLVPSESARPRTGRWIVVLIALVAVAFVVYLLLRPQGDGVVPDSPPEAVPAQQVPAAPLIAQAPVGPAQDAAVDVAPVDVAAPEASIADVREDITADSNASGAVETEEQDAADEVDVAEAEDTGAAASQALSGEVRYAQLACPRGMVRVPKRVPRSRRDEEPVTVEGRWAFCIDRYEAPGRGRTPRTGVSWYQAAAACRAEGKRLCSSYEWRKACAGVYPYGEDYEPETCNTAAPSGAPQPLAASGSHRRCKSRRGVYDMSGNAAEWLQGKRVAGGSSDRDGRTARCNRIRRRFPRSTSPFVGYRCCAEPIIEPE